MFLQCSEFVFKCVLGDHVGAMAPGLLVLEWLQLVLLVVKHVFIRFCILRGVT